MSHHGKISVIFVTYNDLPNLEQCFLSLEHQTFRNFEVIISDNGSTDGTLEYLAERWPQYRIVQNGMNLGYGMGNNVGFKHGTGDYFLVLNNDIELNPDFLEQLVHGLENDPAAKIATPKILLYRDRGRVNCMGNRVHFTGMTFCNGLNEESDRYADNVYAHNFSGACFLMSRQWLEKLGGGFDADFGNLFGDETWMSLEDVDMSLRTQMMGHRILCVASSVMYHKHVMKFTPKKLFFLECGRYMLLAKDYPRRAIMAFLPGLILQEIVVLSYSLLRGPRFFGAKLRTYRWLVVNRKALKLKRRQNEVLATGSHPEVFRSLGRSVSIAGLEKRTMLLRAIESCVNLLFYVLFSLGRPVLGRKTVTETQ